MILMRLCIINDYHISKQYESISNRKQIYVFIRLWYNTADDTKHGKHDNMHVVIRSGDNSLEDDDGFKVNIPSLTVCTQYLWWRETTKQMLNTILKS